MMTLFQSLSAIEMYLLRTYTRDFHGTLRIYNVMGEVLSEVALEVGGLRMNAGLIV
jgi:hypothetical protein